LLHLGEIVEVVVPTIEQEAAQDLVRARDDVRGDGNADGRVGVVRLLLEYRERPGTTHREDRSTGAAPEAIGCRSAMPT
jgi:hypothetical protein